MKALATGRLNLPRTFCIFCLATVIGWQSLAGEAPKPSYELFWAGAPKNDAQTLSLWINGEGDGADSGKGDALDSPADEVEPAGAIDISAQKASVVQKLLGDAATGKDGRWGESSLQLGGKGSLALQTDINKVIASQDRGCTVDFWVYLEKDAPCALLTIPLKGAEGELVWELLQGGSSRLITSKGGTEIIKNKRAITAGKWTHLAFSYSSGVPEQHGPRMACAINGTTTFDDVPAFGTTKILDTRFTYGNKVLVGGGVTGKIDAVRLSAGERLFYELQDEALADPDSKRQLSAGPPHFVRQAKPTLECTFDGSAKPTATAGLPMQDEPEGIAYLPGVRGKAIALVGKESKIAYAGAKLLSPKRGSIEFWFQPQNWNNFTVLDVGLGSKALMTFGKAGTPPLRSVSARLGRASLELPSPFVQIHPGIWTHVVCAWNGQEYRIYLNGRRQAIEQIALTSLSQKKPEKGKESATPDDEWLKAGADDANYALCLLPSGTIIDDLRIHAYDLNDLEAANAYARYLPDAKEELAALPEATATAAYDYNTKQLRITAQAMQHEGIDPASIILKACTEKDGQPFKTAELKLDDAYTGKAGFTTELDFKKYYFELESKSAEGKTLAKCTSEYERAKPAWWQNSIGKDRRVPKPWTPIKAAANAYEVWGRTVTIDKGGLPAQIESAQGKLLASPPAIKVKIAGQEIDLAGKETKLGEAAADLAKWNGLLAGGDLTAKVEAEIEFDGLLKYAITLEPAAGKELDIAALTLDFPLNAEHASQMIVNGAGHNFRGAWDIKMVPQGDGSVWNSRDTKFAKGVLLGNFCPMVWLGDDDRGLCFFGENDKGWTPNKEAPAQEIVRAGKTITYRMNIINKQLKLSKPRTFTFYLHPTPTKPMPADWRGWNRGGRGLETIDACVSPTLTAPKNCPTHLGMTFVLEPPTWEDAKANGEKLRHRNSPAKEDIRLFYINYSWPKLGPSMEEFKSSLWSCGRMAFTREVEDYYTWIINEYIERDIIDGIYIDDTSFGATRITQSTAYVTDEGELQTGFNSLGFRRFLMRTWKQMEAKGKQVYIMPHMTYCFEIPALSFASVCVNGEDRDIMFPSEKTAMQTWGRDELRIQGNPAKWGFVEFWKSGLSSNKFPNGETNSIKAWQYPQVRAAKGLMFQNDMGETWANAGDQVIVPSLVKFGLDDPQVKFIPDWKRQDAIAMAVEGKPEAAKDLMACIHAKPEKALVMISNLGKEDVVASVTFKAERIFGKPGKLVIADMDADPLPPKFKTEAASKEDLEKAKEKFKENKSLGDDDSGGELEEPLEPEKPTDKEGLRMIMERKDDGTLRLGVRKSDFRLLEVSLSK